MLVTRQPFDRPMLLISQNDGKLVLHEQAMEMVSQLKGNLAVVCMVGPYRTGKSFLLNYLLKNGHSATEQSQEGFVVAAQTEGCTRGIWIWGRRDEEGDRTLIALDTEGLFDPGREGEIDEMALFTLAVLLCSQLIINTQSNIDANILKHFKFVVNLAQEISIGKQDDNGEDSGAGKLRSFLPRLLWVVRDFTLQHEGQDRDYLEQMLALANEEGKKAKEEKKKTTKAAKKKEEKQKQIQKENNIKSTLKELFGERDCMLVPPPTSNTAVLNNLSTADPSQIEPKFQEKLNNFVQKVDETAQVKQISFGGETVSLNGPLFSETIKHYVEAINKETPPCIYTAWESATFFRCREGACDALEHFKAALQQLDESLPASADFMAKKKHKLRRKSLRLYDKKKIGPNGEKQRVDLEGDMDKEWKEVQRRNYQASQKQCEGLLERLVSDLNARLLPDALNKIVGATFPEAWETLQKTYMAEGQGTALTDVWKEKEALLKVTKLRAELSLQLEDADQKRVQMEEKMQAIEIENKRQTDTINDLANQQREREEKFQSSMEAMNRELEQQSERIEKQLEENRKKFEQAQGEEKEMWQKKMEATEKERSEQVLKAQKKLKKRTKKYERAKEEGEQRVRKEFEDMVGRLQKQMVDVQQQSEERIREKEKLDEQKQTQLVQLQNEQLLRAQALLEEKTRAFEAAQEEDRRRRAEIDQLNRKLSQQKEQLEALERKNRKQQVAVVHRPSPNRGGNKRVYVTNRENRRAKYHTQRGHFSAEEGMMESTAIEEGREPCMKCA